MATVSIYLDNRTTTAGYSVKYLVTHNRVQRLFSAGKIVSEAEAKFLKQYSGGLRGTVKDEDKRKLWYEVYEDILGKGRALLDELGDRFSFPAFRELLKGGAGMENPGAIKNDVFAWFDAEISTMKQEKRTGNQASFESAKASFLRFVGSLSPAQRARCGVGVDGTTPFQSITVDFIRLYEAWMLQFGKLGQKKKDGSKPKQTPATKTTIGFYLRALRAIYKKQKFTSSREYPFSAGGYTIPKGKKKKKAMESEAIGAVLSYVPLSSYGGSEEALSNRNKSRLYYRTRAYDLWVFTYLSNGLNMADLLRLKKCMVYSDWGQVRFFRQKTKNTTQEEPEEIIIYLLPRAQEILKKWWNTEGGENDSVWNFLSGVNLDDVEAMDTTVNSFIGKINKHMKKIAAELGVEGDVRTYAARHSFATTLLRSEVPIAFISKSLGHKSIATTEAYLGSFEEEQAKRYMSNLLPGGGD